MNKRQSFLIIISLGILNALPPFSIDLYLPAFPEIARDLHTVVPRVSLSVAIYFIGFAIGQIFYGPLLDRFGRKLPIYAGLTIYILASVGCMLSQSVEALLIFRLITALGGCATGVGATAMVRDFFPPKEGAKIFSMLMLVLSVSPLLAPSIGSFMVLTWGWRSLFGILSVMALVDFALVAFVLPNTYKPDPTIILSAKPIFENFKAVFNNSNFRTYTLAGSFSFAGLFVYVAGSPAIFMEGFHVSKKMYGAIFAILAVGMIGGGQLNHLLVQWFGSKKVFHHTLLLQVIVGLAFFLLCLGTNLNLLSTTVFLFILMSCAGITYPNAASLALESFSKNIGSASALLGFLQLGFGSVTAAAVGLIDTRGTLPTAAVMALSSICGLLMLMFGKKSPSDSSVNHNI